MRRPWPVLLIVLCAASVVAASLGRRPWKREVVLEQDGKRVVAYRIWGMTPRTEVVRAPGLRVSDDFRRELARRGVRLRPEEEREVAEGQRTADPYYATYRLPIVAKTAKGAVAYYERQIPSPVRRTSGADDQVSGLCRNPKAVLTVAVLGGIPGSEYRELSLSCRIDGR